MIALETVDVIMMDQAYVKGSMLKTFMARDHNQSELFASAAMILGSQSLTMATFPCCSPVGPATGQNILRSRGG
jgi:hypothetical protein